jgi:6-phosphogluconolactonase
MRACFKLWSVVAVGLAFLPASLRAELVYVANAGSNNVSAFRIAESGALTPVAGSPFPAGRDPRSLAVDLFGLFVYVANAASNNVSAYSIGPNGALAPVAGSPFPAGSDPRSLAVDLLGRFVYVATGINVTSRPIASLKTGPSRPLPDRLLARRGFSPILWQ